MIKTKSPEELMEYYENCKQILMTHWQIYFFDHKDDECLTGALSEAIELFEEKIRKISTKLSKKAKND